ncbi:response regulator receiver domain containing protein [Acanthamoeba castellanii str. Neff]|uniref:Response regulator receiver domain containing protein n=1 Tax=Acanthamoeba castellanii (strain ATCC 30010 / Neff) TaxID=1257118 RepID=L8GNT7_ACACF|nr:response regulator receiver domain containing protein [Acanthamoeba castellanii str. Neff]ELR14664.1 response regulator receiver domain containing protein [Acanthamoeba castellanii str. Neff]
MKLYDFKDVPTGIKAHIRTTLADRRMAKDAHRRGHFYVSSTSSSSASASASSFRAPKMKEVVRVNGTWAAAGDHLVTSKLRARATRARQGQTDITRLGGAVVSAPRQATTAAHVGWRRLASGPAQPLVPPFTEQTARAKVQAAENLWNTKDPSKVALAYTEDSVWRNRDRFLQGRAAIRAFLEEKWAKEHDYRLRKELFCFAGDRIAVEFNYEYRDDNGRWWRAYGLEHWTFDERGLMHTRQASINDVPIEEKDRIVQ